MFGNIKQGNIVYVLLKGEHPEVKIGTVEHVTNPVSKYPTYNPGQPFGQTPEMLVDAKVKCGEETMEFQKLPVNQEIYTYPNAVVSDKKEPILSEVEAMMQTSRQIIESVPYHESVLAGCDNILKQLNPQFAKEKKQEEKIAALETMVGSLRNDIGDIKALLIKQNQTTSRTTQKQ